MLKTSKMIGILLLTPLLIAVCGCSHKSDSASSSMGPMPTAPPGSPYATATVPSGTEDAFVSKLQSIPKNDRAAYMKQNQSVMNSILGNQQNTPAKQKLMAIISQH